MVKKDDLEVKNGNLRPKSDDLKTEKTAIPCHVGFIVDGNRRWAKERELPTLNGHMAGYEKLKMVVEELARAGVQYASFFVFSTENWGRSAEEVSYLMKLLAEKADGLKKICMKNNLRGVVIGTRDRLDEKILAKLYALESATANNTGMTVAMCLNYGGQEEIVAAAKKLAEKGLSAAELKEFGAKEFAELLYHPEVPALDLMVRTSGEERTSGFMLWRAAYSELLFLDKYFPEMEPADVELVLAEYVRRQRRFGK